MVCICRGMQDMQDADHHTSKAFQIPVHILTIAVLCRS